MSSFSSLRSFGRTVFLICLVFLSSSTLVRGEVNILKNLPKDRTFLTESRRTTKLLKALLLEERRSYQSAYRLWRELPQQLTMVRDHVFQSGLFRSSWVKRGKTPNSESSSLLMSRYLSWQRRWNEALQVLEESRDLHVYSDDTRLEMIRLNLSLGNYESAKSMIEHLGKKSRRVQLQRKILEAWYHILKGESDQATKLIRNLEEDFLYLPIATMFPLDLLGDPSQKSKILGKSLVRYPAEDALLENAVRLYQDTEEWQKIDLLIRSQVFLNPDVFTWLLKAETYLKTGDHEQLNQVMQSPLNKDHLPEYFDLLARKAIKEQNWELLNRVAAIYQNRFPYLEDGKIYYSIYLRETGQTRD